MRRHDRASAILVAQEMMAAFDTEHAETGFCECGNEVRAGASGSCRDGDTLDANELQVLIRRAFHFQTQLYGFANALGDLVE